MRRGIVILAVVTVIVAAGQLAWADDERSSRPLRAGMIGLDTSHVIAFTKIINDPKASGDLAGLRIVAGYPGGTDIPDSRDRVERFTEQLRGMGVEIVDTIPALIAKVDVVLLESVDGRPHLEQARPVIEAGKPLFIDKPVAGSLADAVAIYELARQHGVPCFSSSSLRYTEGIQRLGEGDGIGEITGCATWGPCSIQPEMPDLFWYGVHGVEMLFAVMGTGCESVVRAATVDADLVTGVWKGGRIGTFRGIRKNEASFGAVVFGTKGIVKVDRSSGYEPLIREIARFFKTGIPPVSAEETIELFAFMEAADESKRQGGAPVALESVLSKARAAARAKLAK
ncbi:MAG: Gfo/Idh/MocA family oxidoreductase [Planctomycetota bacterium]|nr:Gfo/Idh/MocA family oxidoreductase [Planctomycetota bacterium]